MDVIRMTFKSSKRRTRDKYVMNFISFNNAEFQQSEKRIDGYDIGEVGA